MRTVSEPSLMYGCRVIDRQETKARHRAAPLPPEERRGAIIAATLPLLVAHGTALTTRQIADAAAIAEGTIFRVFPDKDSLIAAAIDQAFDPAAVEAELRAIDAALPLEARLETAVEILQHRFGFIGQLMMAMGMTKVPGPKWGMRNRRTPPSLDTLAAVFEPDRARLRRDPLDAAAAPAGAHLCRLPSRPHHRQAPVAARRSSRCSSTASGPTPSRLRHADPPAPDLPPPLPDAAAGRGRPAGVQTMATLFLPSSTPTSSTRAS